MDSRVNFWRTVSFDKTFDSKELFEELSTDLSPKIVQELLRVLSRGEGVCADVPGAHLHIKWVGYDDWFVIS